MYPHALCLSFQWSEFASYIKRTIKKIVNSPDAAWLPFFSEYFSFLVDKMQARAIRSHVLRFDWNIFNTCQDSFTTAGTRVQGTQPKLVGFNAFRMYKQPTVPRFVFTHCKTLFSRVLWLMTSLLDSSVLVKPENSSKLSVSVKPNRTLQSPLF